MVAVTDVDPERAREVADDLPGGRVHDTGQDVIHDDDVDAVLVDVVGADPRGVRARLD